MSSLIIIMTSWKSDLPPAQFAVQGLRIALQQQCASGYTRGGVWPLKSQNITNPRRTFWPGPPLAAFAQKKGEDFFFRPPPSQKTITTITTAAPRAAPRRTALPLLLPRETRRETAALWQRESRTSPDTAAVLPLHLESQDFFWGGGDTREPAGPPLAAGEQLPAEVSGLFCRRRGAAQGCGRFSAAAAAAAAACSARRVLEAGKNHGMVIKSRSLWDFIFFSVGSVLQGSRLRPTRASHGVCRSWNSIFYCEQNVSHTFLICTCWYDMLPCVRPDIKWNQ